MVADMGADAPPCRYDKPTRAEILRGVVDLIVAHGYQKTTMRMVIASSGLAAGALYRRYATKHDLITAAWRAAINDSFPALHAAVDAENTYHGKLCVLFDELYTRLDEDRDVTMFKLAVRWESLRRPELNAISADTRNSDLIRGIVDFGAGAGKIDRQMVPVARETLYAVVWGVAMVTADIPLDEARAAINS